MCQEAKLSKKKSLNSQRKAFLVTIAAYSGVNVKQLENLT